MKKIIPLLCFLILMSFSSRATHLMGGEIVVGIDSGNTAYVVMTLYRDNSPNTVLLNSYYAIDLIDNSTGAKVPGVSLQLNRTYMDSLPSFYPVERHIYTGTINLPYAGSFHLEYLDCCRNGAINNSTNPLSESMAIYTDFTYFGNGVISATPVFLNPPVVVFPVDTIWSYNPLPFDVDGDSLYWSIDTPVSSNSNYIAGYTTPPANSNGPLSMNSSNGQITWSPSNIGNYVISILVEEYRQGNKIGEIRRDMQFIVYPDTVSMQLVLPPSITAGQGHGSTNMVANSSSSLNFKLNSSYSLAKLSLSAEGEPFELPNSNADFQVQSTVSPNIEGTFSWTPDVNDIRKKPYLLALRASDGKFSYDFTVEILISSAVGLDENSTSSPSLSLYPNPSNGHFTLYLDQQERETYTLQIIDIRGNIIREMQVNSEDLAAKLPMELHAAPGTYIVRLKGGEYYNRMIILE